MKKPTRRRMNTYANLVQRRKTRKDAAARSRAHYLASLPKNPVKRTIYRMHPKRVFGFLFSKRGAVAMLKVAGLATLLVVLGAGALFAYYRQSLDDIRPGQLASRVQTTVSRYYDKNGKLLWEDKGNSNYKLVVESDEIADVMKKATVAIEDKEFYQHGGISISGLVRATLNNASSESVQGGSTLTQQLIKQVYFADEAGKRGFDGIPRKIKEIILSLEVERMYNKDQILNLYLNESPYGGRRNGVESAARTYFGISAKKLNLAQASLLAGIPNQPGLYDPYNKAGNGALIIRQHKVLDSMVDKKYITQKEADAAKKVPILKNIKPVADQYQDIRAPHFVQMVRSELEAKLGKAVVGRGGLTIKTTLDLNMQNILEKEMKSMFKSYVPAAGGFTNGAGSIEDVRTGQVLALMGSRDFRYPGFGEDNSAIASIQPGSSIKPLVYAQLFSDHSPGLNFGSGSILSDTPTDFGGGYKPQNADGGFRGNISVRRSLALSRNIPAIKAMQVSGVDPTLKTIRSLGNKYYCTIGQEKQAGLSSSIGGCGTRLIDHTNAIASLARLGVYKPHTTVLEVKNNAGETLQKYKDEKKQIINPQAAYIVNDILGDGGARLPLYGRSITPYSDAAGIKTAVKTGTSNIEINGRVYPKDIWTMTYTPSLSIGVWLGNPTPTATNSLSSYASLIADPVMAQATKYYQKKGIAKAGEWFRAPGGIQRIGGEIYPSYYNKKDSMSNTKLSFDRVSKKRATKCTPEAAKIEVGVIKTKDPISKKDIFIAPNGYNTNEEDDVHKCNDVEPTVSGISADGNRIVIRVSQGTFPLESISLSVDGKPIGDLSVSGSGAYSTMYTFTKSATISATVKDKGYYSGSNSWKYNLKNDDRDDSREPGPPPNRPDQ
ncbi:penicillin-binding protein [Candidatus Nomurabacteria bacterium]|nr:penicillin-binding protein [Candidatus Nomurabacteria bacterium]